MHRREALTSLLCRAQSPCINRAPGRRFASHSNGKSKHSYDAVIVGSGCAGLTAALVAAKHGLKVLVVEKSKYVGGTTAYSGGGAWIPANKHQPEVDIKDDSFEKGDTYLKQVLGDLYEKNRVHAFLKSGPKMVDWIESNSDVKFKPVLLPDYHVTKVGATAARTILTSEFDGSVLGKKVKDIRYTIQGYHAFKSMQADPAELPALTSPFSNLSNLGFAIKKVLRYVVDELRYGKGALLANGNALIGRLYYSCLQSGVDIWRNSPALGATKDSSGRITGITVSHDGQEETIEARKGIVLASGGFGRSEEAQKYLPHKWTVQPAPNVGDGRRIGVSVGGLLPPPNAVNGILAPVSILKRADGQIRRFPHFSVDRTKPGCVIVGQNGKRFANESEPYQEIVKTMHQKGIEKAYLIGDRKFLRKYGMGMALPWPYPVEHYVRQGYLIKAKTLSELADKIGVSPQILEETVAKCNENARSGVDAEFKRGETIYDQFYGDTSSGLINPSLGFCEKAPFYALPLYPGNVSTVHGLATNENAQVLDANQKPLVGLYAVGLDQNSIFKGQYPGGGSSIGPGMTFGYRAALHMSGNEEKA